MHKILLVGNPNVGKTTLFNSLTKSNQHTGNFHGVTVDNASKIVKFHNRQLQFVDLPGIYSLNTFSYEEELSKTEILKPAIRLVVADANSIRRNLYLCLQLKELGLNYKLLINNFKHFEKRKNKLNINKLKNKLNVEIEIINAKKEKISNKLINFNLNGEKNEKILQESSFFPQNINIPKYFQNIVETIKNKLKINEKTIIFALNGIFNNLNAQQIEYIKTFFSQSIKARYDYIEELLSNCLIENSAQAYGESVADKFLLNPFMMTVGFLLLFFVSVYLNFFWLGPLLSDGLVWLLETILFSPIMNFLYLTTDNIWFIEFFSGGVISSVNVVISFLPQVCLLFIFLSVLEDSGIIARMCYVFDDFLSPFGINGKAVYIMLMGLGCNTVSTLASRTMSEKNLKTKTAILNPYVSCLARLPVFVLLSTAFFRKQAYWVVAGLYLLGLVVALMIGAVLNKTILPTKKSELLLEFPPMRGIDLKHLFKLALTNALDFFKRVFGVVLFVGVLVWILTHTTFKFVFTSTITNSILFTLADKISFLFSPIGLNNAGIVSALLVGVLAKELIVSTLTICNNAPNAAGLISTLTMATSVVNFNLASAVSFLMFSLLYCPCLSNLAVLRKETDRFFMWFSIISQFTIAYVLSFIAYNAIKFGVLHAVLASTVIALIVFAMIFLLKKGKQKRIGCLFCNKNCK